MREPVLASTGAFTESPHIFARDETRPLIWRVVVLIFALMPSLHLMATWDIDGNINVINRDLRLYSLPVVALELAILAIAFLSGWRPLHQFRQLAKSIRWTIGVFVLLGSLSSALASGYELISTLHFYRFLLQPLLLSAIIHIVATENSFDFREWMNRLALGSAAYLILLVAFCLSIPNPESFRWVERIPSATNVRQIGNLVGLMAIVPVTLMLITISRKHLFFLFVLHTALLTFVMWTGTRGALVGYLAAIIVAGCVCRYSLKNIVLWIVPLSWVIATGISISIPNPAPEFGLIRVKQTISSADTSSGRVQTWIATLEEIKKAPLLGYGSGTFRHNMINVNGYPYNHPHNFFLQFVYDWGLIGGGLAIYLVGALANVIIRTTEGSAVMKYLATAAFVGVTTIALIEGTLYHPLPMMFAIALITPLFSGRYKIGQV